MPITATRPPFHGVSFRDQPGLIYGPFETAADAERYLAQSADDCPGNVNPCHAVNVTHDPWGNPCESAAILSVWSARDHDGAPLEGDEITVPGRLPVDANYCRAHDIFDCPFD